MQLKCLFFLLLCSVTARAQDMSTLLAESTTKTKEYVTATFKGTRLINFHTIETGGKRTLDFRISHHFGDINQGAYQFYGLDGGASIRLGLEYSYDGRLQFGLGRSSYEKTFDGFIKYRLLRQTTENEMPISITLVSSIFYNTTKDQNIAVNGYDRYGYTADRLSYAYQVIIARKFNEQFSLQIAPTMVHFNLVDNISDKNDMYALAAATRYKITKRLAITAEYGLRLTEFSRTQKYYNSAGIGIDIETGGHVFQIYFTNSIGQIENQFLARTMSSWQNAGIKLGFNISRVFTL